MKLLSLLLGCLLLAGCRDVSIYSKSIARLLGPGAESLDYREIEGTYARSLFDNRLKGLAQIETIGCVAPWSLTLDSDCEGGEQSRFKFSNFFKFNDRVFAEVRTKTGLFSRAYFALVELKFVTDRIMIIPQEFALYELKDAGINVEVIPGKGIEYYTVDNRSLEPKKFLEKFRPSVGSIETLLPLRPEQLHRIEAFAVKSKIPMYMNSEAAMNAVNLERKLPRIDLECERRLLVGL